MDWNAADSLVAINGFHVTLWVLAYAAWRFLMSPRWAEQQAQSDRGDVSPRVRRRPRVAAGPVEGRWERRAEMLAKMKQPGRPQVQKEPRKSRIAA